MDYYPEDDYHENKLLISSLYVSQLSTRPAGILMGFILMDLAQTFGTTVGIAGQIVTAACARATNFFFTLASELFSLCLQARAGDQD